MQEALRQAEGFFMRNNVYLCFAPAIERSLSKQWRTLPIPSSAIHPVRYFSKKRLLLQIFSLFFMKFCRFHMDSDVRFASKMFS